MRRPGPDEWMQLLEKYEQSGLTQKEFAAQENLSLSTLQYWLYKRSKSHSKIDVNSSPRFLPIEVVASPALKAQADGEVIEAQLRCGARLRFVVGTDTRYLAELFAALG